MLHFKPGAQHIPGYQLVRFLGKGQFGQVWEATAPGGSKSALKFLDLGGKEGWKEFRGIQRVKQLRHANLMPITALWLLDDEGGILDEDQVRSVIDNETAVETVTETIVPTTTNPVIAPKWLVVAQLLGEGTLADELDKFKQQGQDGIPEDQLLDYMAEAAKGIDYLNSSRSDLGDGLVAVQHCDIKPANILLLGGSAQVCDFGVAQVLQDAANQARATGMTGSPAYMSPECIDGTPSPSSDQYSLAVTYVELRTGELPFSVQTAAAVFDAHRSGKLMLDNLAPAERDVILKATSVDPKHRFESCQTMVSELTRAVRGTSVPQQSNNNAFLLAGLAGVLATIAAVVMMGMLPKTKNYTVQVEPADAKVTSNGTLLEFDNGSGEVTLQPDESATLVASHEPDYVETSFVINPTELDANEPIILKLERSASYWAKESARALADGGSGKESAVRFLARAIQGNINYAQFHDPIRLVGKTEGSEVRPSKCSGDGLWLVGSDADGNLFRWSVSKSLIQRESQTLEQHRQVRWWAVGQSTIVSASDHQVTVTNVGAKSESKPQTLMWPHAIEAVAIDPQDRFVVFSDETFRVYQWDFVTSDAPIQLGQHRDIVEKLIVDPSGRTVVSYGWDQQLLRLSLASRDSSVFAALDDSIEAFASGDAFVVFATRREAKLSPFEPTIESTTLPVSDSDVVCSVAINGSGTMIALGAEDGNVTILTTDGTTWRSVSVPNQHVDHAVNAVAFHPQTSHLFSGSNDKSIVIWDPDGRKRPTVLYKGASSIVSVQVSPCGNWLICESAQGAVLVWDTRQIWVVRDAAAAAGVPVRPAEPLGQGVDV